jgi:3-hydroxyacyl-CoA dehydrogenase
MASDDRAIHSEQSGEVLVLCIDSPPVNALGRAVRDGLFAAIALAAGDASVRAIVLLGSGRGFSAGADIREFGRPPEGHGLREVLDAVESSPKPVVAAIHGNALGGGLELALACHYRVAVADARLGLPEVNLGLLPGAGGTQRLPRVVGVARALSMMLSGESVSGSRAHDEGLVDEVVEGDLAAGAIGFARRLLAEGRTLRRVRDSDEKLRAAPASVFADIRRSQGPRQRAFPAREAIIRCVEAAVSGSFDAGMAIERESFLALRDGPESKALRYVFFAERAAAKIEGIDPAQAERPVQLVGVIGAGTMGGGIAMNFLNKGIPVVIVELRDEALQRGIKTIRGNYERSQAKGKLSAGDVESRMGLLRPSLDFSALAPCDLVIEAVFEDMAIKKDVFARLDGIVKPGAILATNTSFLDVNEIAACTARPQDVVGMHFFSPANVMKLLEVVRGKSSAADVIATATGIGRRVGKVPVVVGVCHGFVGNRMLAARRAQSLELILEGAMPWDIDRVLEDFGMPMGPFAMSDLAGLDIGWSAETSRPQEFMRDKLCEMGRRGQKAGAGYYTYDPKTRARSVDPAVAELVAEFARRSGRAQRQVSDTEILERCQLTMVNEGAKILAEGIAQRASDIDTIWVNGYGWPTWRGGPMYWADSLGLAEVVASLRHHAARAGDALTPAPLLVELATRGGAFTR